MTCRSAVKFCRVSRVSPPLTTGYSRFHIDLGEKVTITELIFNLSGLDAKKNDQSKINMSVCSSLIS